MIDQYLFQKFFPISLEKTNEVKLMNRIDSKYVLSHKALALVLENIFADYFVLEINNTRKMQYESLYFDTIGNSMYLAHHNGKLNRYKIRYRNYRTTDDIFLEIKFKNKGIRTIKQRIKVNQIEKSFSNKSSLFVNSTCPFESNLLEPKIYTNFTRVTLVNKNLKERVTIDIDLQFLNDEKGFYKLHNTAIIETKKEAYKCSSPITNTLMNLGVNPTGMSKYCFGRAVLENSLKTNIFKEKILLINKIENGEFYYRNIATTECG